MLLIKVVQIFLHVANGGGDDICSCLKQKCKQKVGVYMHWWWPLLNVICIADIKVEQLSGVQLQISCGSSIVQNIIVKVNSSENVDIVTVSLVCPTSNTTDIQSLIDLTMEYTITVLYHFGHEQDQVECVLRKLTLPGEWYTIDNIPCSYYC